MAENYPKRLVIAQRQIEQLQNLLSAVIPANRFYAAKFAAADAPRRIAHLGHYFDRMPFTTKAELAADQVTHPPFGTNLTYSLGQYTRCHQTSGTGGAPLRWLDTPESWNWMLRNWEEILRQAGVKAGDRVFFAFSFGPFLGFWLAFEAAQRLGCLTFAAGGLGSIARLRSLLDCGANVLCATPTYAIRLAEVAAAENIDLSRSGIRSILVAGEPGGSIPSTRQRIETLWPDARVYDHHGMTEVGPVSFQCAVRPGVLHVLESAYIAEVIGPDGRAQPSGEQGELILTALGRTGSPVLRYRTGDIVRSALDSICECGRSELALEGGILGRSDDMVVVRGVNVYPSAVEDILRGLPEVAEYQVTIHNQVALAEMTLRVEPVPSCADVAGLLQRIRHALEASLSLRVTVEAVASGALPRFEHKAHRWQRS